MREVDVLILGGGPAGATAALNLAPLRRVMIVERHAEPSPRIGESLPGAARRLFRDMGLLESFVAEGHPPCYGQRSVWGDAHARELDSLRDPDGPGWHLDRARFESWLRAAAIARGADFVTPATVEDIRRDGDAWLVTISGVIQKVRAAFVIDAAGRTAPLARRLGARTQMHDRLVCGFVYGRDAASAGRGLTYVEAVADGWWYSAPLAGRRRVLAFHTDSDLPSAHIPRDRDALIAHAREAQTLAGLLDGAGFSPDAGGGFTAAHSATLAPFAGEAFLAAGDAALAFDPLSSQGLLNALFTGLAAAEACDSHLAGDAAALQRYGKTLAGIAAIYRRNLRAFYGTEGRWRTQPFWQRRNQ